MDTNKMRVAFEAMILAEGKSIRRSGDSYRFGTIHRKWLFWQKAWNLSREAVAVELPAERRIRHVSMPGENGSYNEAFENCRDAIEAQGLKVKP